MKIEELNLSSLKYFLDAVELESITMSAEKNHISRPAVSQAIVRLEQWYGRTLLRHKKRQFELTEEGKIFFRLAKQNFENLKLGFLQAQDPDKSLKIGCSASLVDLVFPKIIGLINKSSRPVVKIGPTNQLLDMLDQKKIHIGFLIENQKISHLKSVEFHSGTFQIRSKSGKIGDTLITTEARSEVDSFLKFAFKKKLNFSRHLEVESWTVASRLAEMMNGACLVPDYLPAEKLRLVTMKGWTFPYKAQVITQKDSILSGLESELIQSITLK
ncbi:MAG: LysR family transcriptional regulator [Bdellovibrionota bacterium]